MYLCNFQSNKIMHFFVTMSNSQRKPQSRPCFLTRNFYLSTNKTFLWRLTVPFMIFYYFENDFFVRKPSKLFWHFEEFFAWFSDIKIIFKIIKRIGRNLPSRESKKLPFSYKTIKSLSKILTIRYSQPISHTSTYFKVLW